MAHVRDAERMARKAWCRLMAGAGLLFVSLIAATIAATSVAYNYWLTTGVICYRRTLLAGLLFIGTGGGLTMLVLAWRRLARHSHLTSAAARLASVPLPPALARQVTALGLDGCVTAFASPVPSAFVAGLTRPHIYVSVALVDALDEDELRAVLRHEARHVARRDPWRKAVAQALQTAWSHLPGISRLCHDACLTMELEADAAASPGSAERLHLASALLKVLRATAAHTMASRTPFAATAAGAVTGLDGMALQRLARLTGKPLASAPPTRPPRLPLSWAVALSTGAALLWWCPAAFSPLF